METFIKVAVALAALSAPASADDRCIPREWTIAIPAKDWKGPSVVRLPARPADGCHADQAFASDNVLPFAWGGDLPNSTAWFKLTPPPAVWPVE